MFQTIGLPEIIVILVIVLIIFGPKSLPKIGKAMGKGIREFKDAARGLTEDEEDEEQKPKSKAIDSKPTESPEKQPKESYPESKDT